MAMHLSKRFSILKADAEEWCRGNSWGWRAAVLIYIVYAGYRNIRDPEAWTLFSGLTLALHEMGHLLFSYLGEFLGIAGGSIAQVTAPILAGILLFRQRDYFGVSVAGGWLAISLYELARYIGDARPMVLPLVGFTSDPLHDWNYLLSKMGLLQYDQLLAGFTRLLALLVLLGSLWLGGWLCWTIARYKRLT